MPDRRSPQNSLFNDNLSKVALLAAGGIGIISLMLFVPCVITEKANATDETSGVSTQAVTVPESTLSVSLSSAVELDIVPTNAGTTSSASANLSVTTTDSDSYSVYLSAANNGALVSAAPNNTATIASTDTASTLAGLEANTWGYALSADAPTSDTLYQTLPTSTDTAILTVDTASTDGASDTYNLSFGTKVDGNLPADTYTTEVIVSVVAAPRAPTLSDITYMQDMTPEICAASQENETKRLIDSRDGKYYWVAKLADGNCWMTQNLELSFDEVTTLTPEDSDVSSDWTPGVSMYTAASQGAQDNTTIQAWDLGDYVWKSPDSIVGCGTIVGTLSACPDRFTDVSDMAPMAEIRTDGVVTEDDTYDAHYKVGYYYSWNAATANSGSDIAYGNANDSICPASWQLSYSSSPYNDTPGSFYYLLGQYGVATNAVNDATGYSITHTPLYFVRSSRVGASGSSTALLSPGTALAYWASTSYSTGYAYSLYSENSTVNSIFPLLRFVGRGLRCVVLSE